MSRKKSCDLPDFLEQPARGLVLYYHSEALKSIYPSEWTIAVQTQYLSLKQYADRLGKRREVDLYLQREGVDLAFVDVAKDRRRQKL